MKIRKITLLIATFFLVFGKILVAQNTLVESEPFSILHLPMKSKELFAGRNGDVWVVSEQYSVQTEIVLIDKEGRIKSKFSLIPSKILKGYAGMAFYERNGELHILSKYIDAKIGQQILCDFTVGIHGALDNKREIYGSSVGEKGKLDGGIGIYHSQDKSKMLISFLSKLLVFDSELNLLHETQQADVSERWDDYREICLANDGSIGLLTYTRIPGGSMHMEEVEILMHYKMVDSDKALVVPITAPANGSIGRLYFDFNHVNELVAVCIGAAPVRDKILEQGVGLAIISSSKGELLRKQFQTDQRINYNTASISEDYSRMEIQPNGDILLIFGYTDYSYGKGFVNLMRIDANLELSYGRFFDPLNIKALGSGVCYFMMNDGIQFFRTIPEEVKGAFLINESLKDSKMKFKNLPNYAIVRADFDSNTNSWKRTDTGLHTKSSSLFENLEPKGLFHNNTYYSLARTGEQFTLISWTD